MDFDFPYSLADFLNEECDCQGEEMLAKAPRLVYSTRKVKTSRYSYPLHYHYADNNSPSYNVQNEDETQCLTYRTDTTVALASTTY